MARAVVTSHDGQTWSPTAMPLEPWLTASGAQRIHVTWRSGSAGAPSACERAMVAGLVPVAGAAWLDAADPSVLGHLLAVALADAGPVDVRDTTHPVAILAAVVAATRRRVVDADALTQPARYGRLRFGHHVEWHLLDALRHLAATCPPSAARSGPWWFGRDGLYLEWPAAADALRAISVGNGVVGLPLSPLTVADLLGAAGVLTPPPEGRTWWLIGPNDIDRDSRAVGAADAPARTLPASHESHREACESDQVRTYS